MDSFPSFLFSPTHGKTICRWLEKPFAHRESWMLWHWTLSGRGPLVQEFGMEALELWWQLCNPGPWYLLVCVLSQCLLWPCSQIHHGMHFLRGPAHLSRQEGLHLPPTLTLPWGEISKILYITKRGKPIVNAHRHFSGCEIRSTLQIHDFHIEGFNHKMEIFFLSVPNTYKCFLVTIS